jgi:electron transfer flavoprotein alpha subunit
LSSESGQGVWVVGEQKADQLKSVTFELITAGRRVADALKQELTVVLIGHGLDHLARALVDYAPDNILLVEGEDTKQLIPEIYADVLGSIAVEKRPAAILFGATYSGRDIASRLAAKLGVGLAADCTDLSVDDKGRFVQVRPAFGGNLMATIFQPSARPQLATLRPGMVKAGKPQGKKTPVTEKIKPTPQTPKWSKVILKTVREVAEESGNLDEADIVIGVGRGLGSKENLRLVNQLAFLLHAAIGGSRGVVDAGWLPHNQQIGLTGRAVSPKIYFALGISGAIQHLVGVRTAKQIIAINKDREAPIFKVSSFGIVGDLFVVLPMIIKELEARKPTTHIRT